MVSQAPYVSEGAEDIAREVAYHNKVAWHVFISKIRTRSLCAVRVMAAIRMSGAGYSTPEIGAVLRRDHTSVVAMLNGGKSKMRAKEQP